MEKNEKKIISLADKTKGGKGKLWSFISKRVNNFEIFMNATMNISVIISADSWDLTIKESKGFLWYFHSQDELFKKVYIVVPVVIFKRKLIQV